MANAAIRLSKRQIDALAAYRDVPPKTRQELVGRLDEAGSILAWEELHELVAEALSSTLASWMLISLCANLADSELSPAESVVSITDHIKSHSGWSDEEKKKWPAAARDLEATLNSKALRIGTKAASLAYDCSWIMLECNILSDLRPIFDDRREAIDGAVISQTLRLKYRSPDSDGEYHTLSVAVDANDIRRLAAVCKRSLAKAEEIKKLASKAGIDRLYLPGDSK